MRKEASADPVEPLGVTEVNDFTEDSVLKCSSWHTVFVDGFNSGYHRFLRPLLSLLLRLLGLLRVTGCNRGIPGPLFFLRAALGAIT